MSRVNFRNRNVSSQEVKVDELLVRRRVVLTRFVFVTRSALLSVFLVLVETSSSTSHLVAVKGELGKKAGWMLGNSCLTHSVLDVKVQTQQVSSLCSLLAGKRLVLSQQQRPDTPELPLRRPHCSTNRNHFNFYLLTRGDLNAPRTLLQLSVVILIIIIFIIINTLSQIHSSSGSV